jgi:hypothetical protein
VETIPEPFTINDVWRAGVNHSTATVAVNELRRHGLLVKVSPEKSRPYRYRRAS